MEEWEVERLYGVLRRSAPFAALPLSAFEGTLDMLSGRFASAALRRAPAAPGVGSPQRHAARARGGAADRGDERRDDSRPRVVRRVPSRRGGRPGPDRRAGRGDGLRDPRRGDVPAGGELVAGRGDHARSGHGEPGPGRPREDAFLAGRAGGAHAGVRASDRGAHPEGSEPSRGRGHPRCFARSTIWTPGRPRTSSGISATRRRRPGPFRTIARSSWSGISTRWATGACVS